MQINWYIIIFLSYHCLALAQGANTFLHGPAAMAIGGNFVATKDPAILSPNPAMIFLSKTHYYLASTNLHNLPGLWHHSLQAQWRLSSNEVVGLGLSQYGDKNLAESYFEGRYGRFVAEKWTIGASFSAFQWKFSGYENFIYAGIQGGIGWTPGNQLTLGYTFFSHTLRKSLRVNLPVFTHSLGLNYQPTEQLSFLGQVDMSGKAPLASHWGMRYTVISPLGFSLGFGTRPFTFGTGVHLRPLKTLLLDMALQRHQILGYSYGIGIGYLPSR